MKLYFKILVAIFFMVLSYTGLNFVFGEKGLYAQAILKEQLEQLKQHVSTLKDNELKLQNQLVNLSYDYDTISIYANKLGYIQDGDYIIKLSNMNTKSVYANTPGQYLVLPPIQFVSDSIIKTVSASVGIIVIMIELVLSYKAQKRLEK
ncbi:MAG: septum formation initiator family protein [Spirochaetaceae bacterium]|nr:septum formation initiator family protein [Spirochaetaceae bacterium]